MLISLTLLFCLALVPAGEGQAPDQLPGAAPPAQAAPVPAPFGEIPGLQVEGPPPDWIRPGLRLTYRRDAAYIPSANEMLVEGVTRNMLDLASSSTTGKKYSVEALPGTGSAGYLQFNVLALDAKQAVIQTDFHLFDGLDASAPVQKLESGFVASASMGGDLWMHPDALQKLAGTDSEARAGRAPAQGSAITRVEYKLGEALYQAAQIVQGSPASQSF
ncbi:MAG: hypothetical protein HY812_15205, partial [Planctomycetes bacterium]|nr:hypothetical protein [Planctomycetota bacterium]